jgi:hypothetical protein
MTPGQAHLQLSVVDDADAEEIADAAQRLRAALLELDVADVRQPPAEPVEGAKGLPSTALELLVTGIPAGSMLGLVMAVLRSRLQRDKVVRSIEMTVGKDKIVITGVDSDLQRRATEEWLDKYL